MSNQPLASLLLKGIALAMGVAAAVLSILGTGSPDTLLTILMIAVGTFAVGFSQ